VRERSATQRAYAEGEPCAARPAVTEDGKRILFGQTAIRRRRCCASDDSAYVTGIELCVDGGVAQI
jgi:hypothetical protein